MIIDTHAHLNDERLVLDAEKIVKELKSNNIECCIIAGADIESSKLAVEQAEKYSQYAIIGTHPEDILNLTNRQLEVYRKLSKNPRVVGIGEIGLDYHYEDGAKREDQIDAFERQIALADEVSLPIALHIRDAYGDALDILKNNAHRLNNGVLLHCYSGSKEMVYEFSKFDCYFALGGSITFKNAKKEEVIKAIPLNRLLVETDCPYMAPTPHRGERNEPKYINLVIDKIAEVLKMDRDEIIKITNENTKRLFSKIK